MLCPLLDIQWSLITSIMVTRSTSVMSSPVSVTVWHDKMLATYFCLVSKIILYSDSQLFFTRPLCKINKNACSCKYDLHMTWHDLLSLVDHFGRQDHWIWSDMSTGLVSMLILVKIIITKDFFDLMTLMTNVCVSSILWGFVIIDGLQQQGHWPGYPSHLVPDQWSQYSLCYKGLIV